MDEPVTVFWTEEYFGKGGGYRAMVQHKGEGVALPLSRPTYYDDAASITRDFAFQQNGSLVEVSRPAWCDADASVEKFYGVYRKDGE